MPGKSRRKRGGGGMIPSVARFMPIPFMCVFLCSTLFALFFSPLASGGRAHAAGTPGPVKLTGHVPALERRSALLGATNPQAPLQLSLSLQPRNLAAMQALAKAVSDPHSALAHHYLTPQQVAARFAPDAASQNAVIAFMRQNGFQLAKTYTAGLALSFRGTIGQAEAAFKVRINNYRAPGGRIFYAPSVDPTIPGTLAGVIQSVVGLDTAGKFYHPPAQAKRFTPRAGTHAHDVTCIAPGSGYYLPQQIARAYNLLGLYGEGFQGQNQTIGLFELDGFIPDDITAYTGCYGGGSVPISTILVDGGPVLGAGAIEVELDMELILSADPQLGALRVYEAPNTDSGLLDNYSQMILTDNVPVISTSWGLCEPESSPAILSAENNLFTTATIQGESTFAAAGDAGSNDCGGTPPIAPTVDDPASQPYVTGVGGSSLTINNDSSYHSESVWNDGPLSAGGGGVSSVWQMPAWQQGPGVVDATYSSGGPCGANTGYYCREVPDVSLHADPANGYMIYCTVDPSCSVAHPWLAVGGTSAAAPLWAAMTALANEKSQNRGGGNLGFLSPMLYQIEQNAAGMPFPYATAFHDITSGNNYTTDDGNGEYPARANYDMASGLGSYDADKIVSDLIGMAAPASAKGPVSKTWYFAEGKVGQGFTEYLTLSNPSTTTACTVNLAYLLSSGSPVNVVKTIAAASRFTESVNGDLRTAAGSSSWKVVSIIITTTNSACPGIVAERPIYFSNFMGISSGTDALGATGLSTLEYFGDIPTGTNFHPFITALNPSASQAIHLTVHYYSGGSELSGSPQVLTVAPDSRGTLVPPNFGVNAAASVSSDGPMAVEVPIYFSSINGGNAGTVSGASILVGRGFPSASWRFAEGYTGAGFQTYLELANLTVPATVQATVYLDYHNGHYQTLHIPVGADSVVTLDINALNSAPVGTCDTTPCQTSPDVSLEVYTLAANAPLIAERVEYYHYAHTGNQRSLTATGGTFVVGQSGPKVPSAYSFAEGYTFPGYDEWLTLLNPNNATATITITLNSAVGRSVTRDFIVARYSRTTIDITAMVLQYLIHPGDSSQAYAVSMMVSSNDGTFLAERPMYWNAGGTQGGSDVIGFNAYSNES